MKPQSHDELTGNVNEEKQDLLGVNNNDNNATTTTTAREDDWGLSMEFHLFAQHEEYSIALPNQTVLKLFCVESLTPLDMMHLGSGIYDATGHCAWTASFLFLRMIPIIQEQFQCFADKRILELGCGTGIGGLAVALMVNNAHVVLTDHDPQVLQLCQRNCDLNKEALLSTTGSSLEVRQLTWGCNIGSEDPTKDEYSHFDTVFATDVLYDISLLKPLLQSAYDALSSLSSEDRSNNTSPLLFVLSHVPRACYNKEHPPVDDLDVYIAEMAKLCGFSLERVYRPCEGEEETALASMPLVSSLLRDSLSLREMEEIGASIFIFQK